MNLKYVKRNETFGQILRDLANEHPEREAVVFQDQRISFGELFDNIEKFARSFVSMGIGKGDNVSIILPNCPEYLYIVGALAYIGAAAVPMSVQSGSEDMRHILQDSESVAVVLVQKAYGANLLDYLREMLSGLPHLRFIFLKDDDGSFRGNGQNSDIIPLERLFDPTGDHSKIEPIGDPSTPAMILYTSGTTGAPKGAVHTHRTLLMGIHLMIGKLTTAMEPSLELISQALKTTKTVRRIPWLLELFLATRDLKQIKLLLLTPMYHIAGYFQILLVLLTGGRIVIMERFHPQKALELVQKERVTLIFGVPPQFKAMIGRPDFNSFDLSSIVLSVTGAMVVPPQLIKDMKQKIGGFVMIVYGATEMIGGTITWATDPEEKQTDTVGKTDSMGEMEIKIVNENRQELPRGEVGEIVVRSPTLMDGYYNRPEATAEALDRDGWYYSGDMGMIDEQGYVHVLGRRGDLIIRAGANIYPAEIENHLLTHPKINQVAVVGIPGEGGEKVCAYIVTEEGTRLEAGDIINFCWGKIAAYKVPEEVIFVEELPVTPALQKVKHYKLKQQAIKEQNAAGT